MFKVAIFGTENSHASRFIEIFQKEEKYSDIKITHIGGMYKESNELLKSIYPDLEICENPEDIVDCVDAVMVTCRDGKYHTQFALPFIKAGKPAFIDKPFTRDIKDAEDFIKIAKEKNVPIVGGSSLKNSDDILELYNNVKNDPEGVLAGNVIAPLNMINDYGGFWFYSSHLAEMTLKVFGYDPIEVEAREYNNSVTVITKYDKFTVTNHFVHGGSKYSCQVVRKEEILSKNINTSKIYEAECDEFANMLRTGEMYYTYEQLIKPVKYLACVEQSYLTKKPVKVL